MKRGVGALIASLFVAAVGLVGWRAYDERRDQASAIAYRTAHGVKVVKSPSGWAAPREITEKSLNTSMSFWCARYVDRCPQFRAALSSASLGFVDTPTVRYAGASSNARGLTVGRAMAVSGAWPLPTVAALITHESGHIFLTIAGVPEGDNGGENHHKVMAEAGFAY